MVMVYYQSICAKRRRLDIASSPQAAAICRHGALFKGVCIGCSERAEEEDERSSVDFHYLLKGLRLTSWGIQQSRGANTRRLLAEKKLALILDLDHTLLHSKPIPRVPYEEDQYLLRLKASSRDDDDTGLHRLDATWTKLRPFVRPFLREANAMFDMHVYTNGNRAYALQMAQLLDPEGEFFVSKVIAREDSTTPLRKSLDIVLAEESVVLILDDTTDVWEGQHRGNLVAVPKYNFFAPSQGCQKYGAGRSMSELKVDESKSEGTLANALALLKQVHGVFYDPELEEADFASQDIKEVLKKIYEASVRAEGSKPATTEQPIACSS